MSRELCVVGRGYTVAGGWTYRLIFYKDAASLIRPVLIEGPPTAARLGGVGGKDGRVMTTMGVWEGHLNPTAPSTARANRRPYPIP